MSLRRLGLTEDDFIDAYCRDRREAIRSFQFYLACQPWWRFKQKREARRFIQRLSELNHDGESAA